MKLLMSSFHCKILFSAVWGASMSSLHDGSRPQLSHISDNSTPHPVLATIDRLGKHTHAGPAYFAAAVTSVQNAAAQVVLHFCIFCNGSVTGV